MKDKESVGRLERGDDDELLDKLRVALWLVVSVGMVDVLRRKGKLRAIKVGRKVRFERAEVKRYLNSEREGGGRGGKRHPESGVNGTGGASGDR